ncbi:MAG: lytic transglycosylase domain-containing protein [Paracoccaceae bacterium]
MPPGCEPRILTNAKINCTRFVFAITIITLLFQLLGIDQVHANSLGRTLAPEKSCTATISKAAHDNDVPNNLLRAIALVESGVSHNGGNSKPWPWSINFRGESHRFPDQQTAERFAYELFMAGERNFDIGCFQINFAWHGQNFRTVEEMFDPHLNAQYAAKFLKQLYFEHEDWMAATGAYHSRTEDLATSYIHKILAVMEDNPRTDWLGDSQLDGSAAPGKGSLFVEDIFSTSSSLFAVRGPGLPNWKDSFE